MIVPRPVPSAIVACTGLPRMTLKPSFASSTVSPRMAILMILEVSPAAKVTVPAAAVKSAAEAVPDAVW